MAGWLVGWRGFALNFCLMSYMETAAAAGECWIEQVKGLPSSGMENNYKRAKKYASNFLQAPPQYITCRAQTFPLRLAPTDKLLLLSIYFASFSPPLQFSFWPSYATNKSREFLGKWANPWVYHNLSSAQCMRKFWQLDPSLAFHFRVARRYLSVGHWLIFTSISIC